MKFKIKDHIKNGDIVANIEETYPSFILDMKRNNVDDEDLFYTYLYQNNFFIYSISLYSINRS